jgi:putative PEP-CTERM system integral membrane protein
MNDNNTSSLPVRLLKNFFVLIFWVFNLTLLLIAYFGVLPFLSVDVVTDMFTGKMPLDFLLPFIGLVGVPTTLTVVGARRKKLGLRTAPSLLKLFYGVELPLLFLCTLRFFWLKELTLASSFMLAAGALGMATYTYKLFAPEPPRTKLGAGVQMAGSILMFAIAIYILLLTTFYVPPLLILSLKVLPNLLVALVYLLVAFPLFAVLVSLLTLPFGMGVLYIRAWRQQMPILLSQLGRLTTGAIAGVLAVITLVVILQPQPQAEAFRLLSTPADTVSDRQALLAKSETIRQGLLNAYLYSYRYLGLTGSRGNVFDAYKGAYGLPDIAAEGIQSTYNWLLSPFLYQGSRNDADQAVQRYAQFFDTPILRAEPQAIQHALQSTFMRSDARAGLMDVNQQKVLLAEQDITVTPNGDWADVEIHEVYENQTSDQQEVLYYFSLPESAAVTGVWLGNSANRADRFAFTVSPRGAAQQVYANEVQRRIDPALLEQVGPRNYRLRAFPVLPRGNQPMHLWLTYKVMQQQAGWPLPQLNERRNIFWTADTRRRQNGTLVKDRQTDWLPAALPAATATPISHDVTLPGGDRILAKPFPGTAQLPQGQRFAVVLDSSRSMAALQPEVKRSLDWLREKVLPQNQVDLYLTSAEGMVPQRLDQLNSFNLESASFYGTLQPKTMLRQFLQLRGSTNYDAILVLTDATTYELSDDSEFKETLTAPLWFVHLGGKLQPAYDDDTLQAIQQSQGGVATQAEDVLQRRVVQASLGDTGINWVDGYAWFQEKANLAAAPDKNNFAAIAARQWIQAQSQQLKSNQPADLDAIHTVAKQQGIVTPYSSMIVLVNDRQKEALKNAEKQSDRFNREVEDQQLPKAGNITDVTGVPEPEEWLLLLMVAIGLGSIYGLSGFAKAKSAVKTQS